MFKTEAVAHYSRFKKPRETFERRLNLRGKKKDSVKFDKERRSRKEGK